MTDAPKNVVYCGVCTFPPEYCEFGASLPRCQKWLEANHPDLFTALYSVGGNVVAGEKGALDELDSDSKKLAKAIGKEEAKLKRVQEKKASTMIVIKRIERTKKKRVTSVLNLEVFDVELKKAAKQFASRFACGSSVSKNNQNLEEIVIQGDVSEEVKAYILQTWKTIPEKNIQLIEEKKKKKPEEEV
ncbi:translation initiation factor SUI1 [Dimargaris cristalligena]|uniref:Translation machinery-associated protein 22 n=1 Tax=Dimargaris cristalligena TaxID=215637 RepID=A0A4P9ZWG3_9FUNG|nr:translation initiation factor SUI1 [Dimargaris cristalligena]|eukprot:RKP37658.1 translation initiation factor SUI1 [Dimargaris cristalligena]